MRLLQMRSRRAPILSRAARDDRSAAPPSPVGVRQLAQANVARLRAPLDDPSMRDFVAALDHVNHLAETSRGFVWRLTTEHGHGLCVITEDAAPSFLNLSV